MEEYKEGWSIIINHVCADILILMVDTIICCISSVELGMMELGKTRKGNRGTYGVTGWRQNYFRYNI